MIAYKYIENFSALKSFYIPEAAEKSAVLFYLIMIKAIISLSDLNLRGAKYNAYKCEKSDRNPYCREYGVQ